VGNLYGLSHQVRGLVVSCCKPQPGLLVRSAREHGQRLGMSLAVGDRARAIEAADGPAALPECTIGASGLIQAFAAADAPVKGDQGG
jgi:hypothetical protein